jgi:hypothetical protein
MSNSYKSKNYVSRNSRPRNSRQPQQFKSSNPPYKQSESNPSMFNKMKKFGNFNKTSSSNSSSSPNSSSSSSSSNNGNLYINYLVIFVLSLIILVLFSFMLNYYFAYCEKKKTLYNYLLDLKFNEPCYENTGKQELQNYLKSTETSIPISTPRTGKLGALGRVLRRQKEVYNIGDQIYTYKQAQEKCATYNADLATYEQITDAYNNGADWCTYGWSQGRNAYYPTQPHTWKQLQQLPPRFRRACGKVGINGGKFPKKLKLGANCYGIKPVGTMPLVPKPIIPEMGMITPEVVPMTKNFCDKERNFNSCNKLTDDKIKPFNNSVWSQP